MITFAVCDDEPLMVRELTRRLSEYLKKKQITACRIDSFSNGRALLDSAGEYDVVFLDIQMEPPDGMETARLLRRRNNQSILIFVTVLKEYVFDAFEAEAYDYLLKPIDAERFERTMDRVLKVLERRTEKSIVVQRGASCEVLPLSQIVYCEVQGRKLYLHLGDGSIVDYYDRLDAFARRVDGRFFRCHRSYLVNLDYVRGLHSGQVALLRGGEIPVSRLRERDMTRALLRHMKERDG